MAESERVEDLRAGDSVQTTATVVRVCIDGNGVSVEWAVTPPIAEHFVPLGTIIDGVTHPAPPEE